MAKKQSTAQKMAETVGKLATVSYELLEETGNEIAQREGYKNHSGIEAVHFYLMNKHHWTPAQIKAMTLEDLCFAVGAN